MRVEGLLEGRKGVGGSRGRGEERWIRDRWSSGREG